MYYFVTKETVLSTSGRESIQTWVYGCREDTNCWLDVSITHKHVFRYNDEYEAQRMADRVWGKVVSISKEVYDWLVEERRLDEESKEC